MNDFNTDALVIRTLPSGDSDRLNRRQLKEKTK